jgi:hypothetical protein
MALMLFVAGSGLVPTRGSAQQQPGQIPGAAPQGPRTNFPTSNDTPDPLRDKQESNRAKALNDDRHKRMVADSDKLLQLATELKTEVDKSTKDEMSLTVIKKAAELEKLAHDVKERMKGQ